MRQPVPIRTVLFCTLLVALFALLPQVAQAGCHGLCKNVAPPGEFCRRCVDAGTYTGVACQDVGACGCFYVRCPYGLSQLSESPLSAELVVPADLTPMSRVDAGSCTDTVASVSEAPPKTPAAEPVAD